jgi:hypothetical protein
MYDSIAGERPTLRIFHSSPATALLTPHLLIPVLPCIFFGCLANCDKLSRYSAIDAISVVAVFFHRRYLE